MWWLVAVHNGSRAVTSTTADVHPRPIPHLMAWSVSVRAGAVTVTARATPNVTATVSGAGELLGLVIKPEAVDPEDTETLADLVLAAVRDATGKSQALAAAKLGPLTGGMGGLGF